MKPDRANVPSKTDVEAALFRHACWCRGRILEAAFGLLLGASQTEAARETKVAPATVAKVARVLKKEFATEIRNDRTGNRIAPVPLNEAEREVVHRAAEKAGVEFAQYARGAALDRAYADLQVDKVPEFKASIDWAQAAKLAAGGQPSPQREVVAEQPPAPLSPPTPLPAPTKPRPAISVPRDPDVAAVVGHRDRRQMLRDRFRAIAK